MQNQAGDVRVHLSLLNYSARTAYTALNKESSSEHKRAAIGEWIPHTDGNGKLTEAVPCEVTNAMPSLKIDNRVVGTVNFRGRPIPINGFWNENTKLIAFDSPYATFSGNLTIIDDQQSRIRHFILQGRFLVKPPSLQAGESGS
ncbi:hypothetical protein [Peribacillus sp. AS_2]|uniref:hypothetical protein n=1 Tax=Peribacillus sp. AS_2 TaxID=2996755 RepID=UPI0022A7F800|nr:hypothetical protein [Peribacillus sp. AS_2]MCZ0874109.1 hypothetical protein [Peribacillus sp. AS_2]